LVSNIQVRSGVAAISRQRSVRHASEGAGIGLF
jgi:hypothetical protein